MNNIGVTRQLWLRMLAASLLAAAATSAGAVDLKTADGEWTFSLDGNVNVDYIFSSCQSASTAVNAAGGGIAGALTCVGTASGSNVSNIGNGLLPAAFAFAVATTQNGLDISAHLGLYPGIATNDGGSPNLQANRPNGSSNTALGTTGLDIRQVYMTFGNKTMGTFTLGRNIGLFGADVILNDMTLPGVGAPGSAATAAPSNTTLGGIGWGYIYTDWLAQMDYTTPDVGGFNLTLGIFDPLNSLTDIGTVQPKKSPGFHGKLTWTLPLSNAAKLYASATFISQQQYYVSPLGTPYNYTGTGADIFVKLDVQDFEAFGYYYHGDGLGTTALFLLGTYNSELPPPPTLGAKRTSHGYLVQATYKFFGALKLGVQYGESDLDTANAADAAANPFLVSANKKFTGGVYYSLTKNLTLLAEGSSTTSDAQGGGSNKATTINVGAYLAF